MAFQRYASYYDAFYQGKDYQAECDFIETILQRFAQRPARRILDLGCGTGGHSIPLALRGYRMTGVDRSAEMISRARRKATEAGAQIEFQVGDLRSLNLGAKFDCALAMFAVISYQTSNEDLLAAFHTARRHLHPGGLFIFDTWFGPSVLTVRPARREKAFESEGRRVVRVAEPSLDLNRHIVEVAYTVRCYQGQELVEEVHELHRVRFLFVPEVELLCRIAGLELVHYCPFMELDRPPGEEDWNVAWIVRAP